MKLSLIFFLWYSLIIGFDFKPILPVIETLSLSNTKLNVKYIEDFKKINFNDCFCNIFFYIDINSIVNNETDEKLHDLYFYTGEYDEVPVFHPFRIRHLYNPVISDIDLTANTIMLTFGPQSKRTTLILKVRNGKISF